MNRIINWLLLIIIFVFDPLAIALVIAANFAFAQLRPKKEHSIEDNEGSDIYTEEDFSDWDSTLNDGLEDLPWEEEQPKGVPVYFDPKTGRPYIIEETEDKKETKDKDLTEEEKQYDSNNDGVLDNQEKDKMVHDKMLDNPGISSYTKRKIRNFLEGNTKKYW